MPSTDIDGTPILMFGTHEIEYLAELMEQASRGVIAPVFGDPMDPIETSIYKRMQKFLTEHDVMCWLDDFDQEVAEDMLEQLKEKGVYDGKD